MSKPDRIDLLRIEVLETKRTPHGEITQVIARCVNCGEVKTIRRRPLLLSDTRFCKICKSCGLASRE